MKTSNSVISAAIVSLLGFSATLSAPQAMASDQKVYPASMCNKYAGAGSAVDSYGSLINDSTAGYVYLDCPVVRDHPASDISSGFVQVTDRSFGSVGCYLAQVYRRTNDSSVVFFANPSTSYNTSGDGSLGPGLITLRFNPPASGIPDGHYYYSCYIPPADDTVDGRVSEIHSYSVTEVGGND